MYIIKDYTELPLDEIDNHIRNFKPTELKGIDKKLNVNKVFVNEYTKEHLTISSNLINSLEKMVLKYFPNYQLRYNVSRLNLVETNTNPSDNYHNDIGTGNIIVLHYPKSNPYFKGGQLQWSNDIINEIIEIENGLNIILVDNPPHRVLNVTEGKRFSFAFFFERYKQKGII